MFESGINGSGENQGEKKTAKDSIMALYGNSGGQQQMFGVPGKVNNMSTTNGACKQQKTTNYDVLLVSIQYVCM